jgi:elongation factor Ts
MADISTKDVAALRKATGAGMMDCKRALSESGGDIDAAKDWLRQKGLAGASKRAGREANEGAIEVLVEGPDSSGRSVGALVELNCETDFVAKGDVFRRAVTGLTRLVIEQGDADLGNKTYEGGSVEDFVNGMSGTLGEKIQLGRVARFETSDGLLDGYKHVQNERGTVGVLVELGGVDTGTAQAREVAHDIALHIASAAPRFVSRDDIPEDVVTRERAVLEAQTREEGKPEQALGKIVEGKLNGFFKSVALLEQPFVKDQKTTIKALVDALGDGASVRRFVRVKIGEE